MPKDEGGRKRAFHARPPPPPPTPRGGGGGGGGGPFTLTLPAPIKGEGGAAMASDIFITPIAPTACSIEGIVVVPRVIHFDGRGFLVEGLRKDDEVARGHEFHMAYTSLSVPGAARDADRWHHHALQQDRYLVITGAMLMAFYDPRPSSPTQGCLEVLRVVGASSAQVAEASSSGQRFDVPTHLVMIPIGVS